MEKITCSQLKIKLAEIKDLKKEFDLEMEKVRETKKTDHACTLKKEIIECVDNIKENILPEGAWEQVKDWQNFYRQTFGLNLNFFDIKVPKKKEGCDRLIVVENSLDINTIYKKCEEYFKCRIRGFQGENKIEDFRLETIRSIPSSPYCVWINEKSSLADDEKNMQISDYLFRFNRKLNLMTAEEGLLDILKEYVQGGSLIVEKDIIFGGSRFWGQSWVPSVYIMNEELVFNKQDMDAKLLTHFHMLQEVSI